MIKMNFFILIMLFLCLLGLLDKGLNNKLGLAAAFDRGMATMGSITMSMVGFYCIAISLIQNNIETITKVTANLPIDPSIIIGSILAPDMGGYSLVEGLGAIDFILFSGILLTSSLGQTISFQMPIFLSSLNQDDLDSFINGLVYGILSLPIVLIIVAWLLQIPNLVINLLPIICLCLLLVLALAVSYRKTLFVLTLFGYVIKMLSIVLFGLVILQLFFTDLKITSMSLISEALVIVLKMIVVVCGSMILSDIIIKKFPAQVLKLSRKLGINSNALIGLLLSLGTSIAMIPLFSKMDRKGKIINGAFSVSGAFVFGGQLGFIAGIGDSFQVLVYILFKLSAGILAIILVMIFYRDKEAERV